MQATALVHEAYIRLVDVEKAQHWNSRGHFFAAAAEAMRRILVENARRKARVRHGCDCQREELRDLPRSVGPEPETILAVDEALTRLAEDDPVAADVVKLHFFAGMTLEETAEVARNLTRNCISTMGLRSRVAPTRAVRTVTVIQGPEKFLPATETFWRFLSH